MGRGSGVIEIFKFAVYVSFPIFCMVHYGDPAWYHKHVKHLVPAFTGQTVEGSKMPKNPEELKEMILEIKEKKRQARLEREAWPESERWSSQLPILPEKLKEDPPQRLV